MITRPTVLVLGAGASAPFAFPSGRQLAELVWRGLSDNNHQLSLLLQSCGFDASLLLAFSAALRRSARPSVDVFLEHRPEPEFLQVGKTAIAASLIPYEVEGNLFDDRKGNWYKYLFNRLGPDLLEDVAPSRLSVITFNYDRSLDHFLFEALRNSHGLTEEKAARYLLVGTPIIHVYGKLGELPYVGGPGVRPYSPSEGSKNASEALAAKDSIKIVSEGVEGDPEFGRAKQLLSEAEVICFLGFGYLKKNVERLGLEHRPDGALLWGSAYDVRKGEREAIDVLFRSDPNKRGIALGDEDDDVLDFLREHPVLG